MTNHALNSLADLLAYPGANLPELIFRAQKTAGALAGEASQALDRFARGMARLTAEEQEEVFTATFDLSPACAPYVSIHLFGEENFKRGEFMAALQARYASLEFKLNGELPDHLAILLRFAARVQPVEQRELAEYCLLGPLDKMRNTLTEENPYLHLLGAVKALLQAAHPEVRAAVSPVEQMRTHGDPCGTVSAGCSCGTRLGADSWPQPKQQTITFA